MTTRARPVVGLLTGLILLWLAAFAAEQGGVIPPLDGLALDALTPVQTATVALTRPLQNLLAGLAHSSDLARENEALRQQMALLETEVTRLHEYALENQELRRDLVFKNRQPDLEFIRARVISEDPSNYVNAILVDQGQSAGVAPGMVAVSGEGLLGKVSSVTASSAKIVLAVDPSTSIYAVVQREDSRASGVVEGAGQGRLVLKWVSQTADIRSGDTLVTSGRGGTYPGGIEVGRIGAIQRSDVASFQQADVQPAVDVRHLETILIVANFLPATGTE
jgi:rod shape-determining protein MreC